ncbi:hypothetical protein HGM15179_019300 [Zosterops borbonicus]|uniref:ribonuclease H n=1 Tax=Zosterops borbonicus TaxID=364589 RepID=A0A8K1FXN7_9PASS|nr:hypothetical protein HGM15179_019300 [Zosterops borbonicus]
MIRQAGIQEWEHRNPQRIMGDQKWPSQNSKWNAQSEEGRRNMVDLRNIAIQGIRDAVPRGQNISKVFGECQERDETHTEWLDHLRKSLQVYSGTDTNSLIGEVLLKIQFVAKSWEDIRRKLEKLENWQERGLQELLREAQKVYTRRDEEEQKVQAKDVEIESENKICLGDMLLVEEIDYNLLGRDLIVALGINLMVKESQLVVSLYKLTTVDEDKIDSKVWYAPGKAGQLEIEPICIEIEKPEEPIRIKQYPISMEGRRDLKPVIDDLVKRGTLEPCMSRQNTPILAIRKTDGSYRLVQDLSVVNGRTRTKFPVVANPYTLLNRVCPGDTWYSVIDLKDAFWTCPLAEESRDYFAFQWEDPETNRKQQFTWTSLPQGFVDSLYLFGQALEQLLSQFEPIEGTKLLQYVDDLLVAGPKEEDVRKSTIALLNFLGNKGLKVSKSKLQFTEPEIRYLGHWITKGVGVADNSSPKPDSVFFGEPLEGITHDCAEVVELQTKIRPDLEEEELEEGEKWFVDGSARVVEGKRRSGYAIVDGKTGNVVESGPLSAN